MILRKEKGRMKQFLWIVIQCSYNFDDVGDNVILRISLLLMSRTRGLTLTNRNVKQMLVAGTKRGKIQFWFLFSLWLDQYQPITSLVTAGTNEDRIAHWIIKLQLLSSTGKWGTVFGLFLGRTILAFNWNLSRAFAILSFVSRTICPLILCYVDSVLFWTASEFTSTSSTSDGVENISSDSNMYSVFGGEFVANKRGKRLDRDRWVCSVYSHVLLFS